MTFDGQRSSCKSNSKRSVENTGQCVKEEVSRDIDPETREGGHGIGKLQLPPQPSPAQPN